MSKITLIPGYHIQLWRPRLFSIAPKGLLTPVFTAWWLFHWLKIFKNPNYKIYLVYTKEQKLAHYTVLIPAHYRFPFMHDKDLQIGPIGTKEDERRNGLAHYILHSILNEYENKCVRLWYITREENMISKSFIEKANFEKIGEGKKVNNNYTRLFSYYYISKGFKMIGNSDKQTELERYDSRAQAILETVKTAIRSDAEYGSLAFPLIIRTPYSFYEQCIRQNISKEHYVLEIAAGTGMNTYALTQTGAQIVASDISSQSLEILSQRLKSVRTIVADIEALPFEANSFDVVVCAGGLSYGNPTFVDAEIRRVLRPGGIFICVDTLNHNPIYRFNRWLHYKRGERTKSTLLYMPTIDRIQSISRGFKDTDVRFFGAISYILPALAYLIGQIYAAKISDIVDRLIHVRRSAFKFVMVARGRL
jgi:SAM-dependent methyltransferase